MPNIFTDDTVGTELPPYNPTGEQLPLPPAPPEPGTILEPFYSPTPDSTDISADSDFEMMQGPIPDRAKQIVKTSIWNIAKAVPDTVMGVASPFFIQPLVSAVHVAQALPAMLDDSESFVDKYISLQSKLAAREGIYGWLNYAPATEGGATAVGAIMTPFNWLGEQTRNLGSAMADIAEAGLQTIETSVREKGSRKDGGWTAADEMKLADVRSKANGTLGAVFRTSPDAALVALPAAWLAGRRAKRIAEARENIKKVAEALEPRTVTRDQISKLENFNNEPFTPEEINSLNERISKGEISKDVSIETFQGRPTRILTGADTVRAFQLLETRGLRMKSIQARFVEKDSFSPTEQIVLTSLAESAFAELVKNEQKLHTIEKLRGQSFAERFTAAVIDKSGNVKRELFKKYGPEGELAVQMFEVIAGATPRAHLIFQDLRKKVWGKKGKDDLALSHTKQYEMPGTPKGKLFSEHDLFDAFAHAKRVQEIVRYKPGKIRKKAVKGPDGKPIVDDQGNPVFERVVGDIDLAGPIDPANAAGALYIIKQKVGAQRYAQFEERLADFHDTMRSELKRMLDYGLISEESFNRMKDLDYLTRKFVSEIDPYRPQVKGQSVTVRESGIEYLEGGTKELAFQTDVEMVAAEHIARIERRIARNRATSALAKAAEKEPGIVIKPPEKGGKIPEGYTEIHYFEKGEKKSLWMEDRMAAEWVYGDIGISTATASALRMLSGSSIVKAMATGYNPEFAVRNLARDLQHIWRATGTEYNSFAPVYLGQILNDMIKVSKDVWNKTGVYKEYIMEGGGFEMLTHQGRNLLIKTDDFSSLRSQLGAGKGKWGERYNQLKDALSKINEYSELITRLAIRERVLKNQRAKGEAPNPERATWLARRYIDFSQGGSLTKALDTTIPYLNANIQALRTGLRPYTQGGKIAGATVIKDLQLVGIKAALQARYWQDDPEQMRMVSDETLVSNFIIPTGMWITDDDGTRKPILLRFPLDSSVVPLTGPLDLLLKKAATGENPDINILDVLKQANPVTVGSLPPTVEAVLGMASNYNFYTNDQIWKGEPVLPGSEFTESTPEVLKLMGELAPDYISPARLGYGIRTLAPTNTYIYGAQFTTNMLMGSNDPVKEEARLQQWQDQTTEMLMTQAPGLKMIFTVGQPAEAMSQIERQALLESNSLMKSMREDVERAVKAYSVFKPGDPRRSQPYRELVGRVVNQYADRQDILNLMTDTFKTKLALDIVWDATVPKDFMFPSKDSFVHMGTMDPESRAKIFYQAWRNKDEKGRKDMFKIAAAVDSVSGGTSFLSPRFMQTFQKEKAKWGEEKPLHLGE